MEDRVQNVTLNISIIDDSLMESNETFKVQLSNVTGGALLGAVNVATVVILKSDYPNGNFLFRGPLFLDLPNPATPTKQTLSIERTGGALGQQQVFWRIMGPNNAMLQLVGTGDISSVVNNQDVTQGSLTWQDGELGVKQLVIDIKTYTTWEVEKSFVVELYRVSGTPTGVGDGEVVGVQGKLTIKVNRFGDPSGVIRFTGTSVDARQVLEPDGTTPVPLVFPVTRRNDTGVIGNIQIYWEVKGTSTDSPDVQPLQGSLSLGDGRRDGQITLQILPDDIPELTETFTLILVKVEGGAQIDTQFNQSTFSIKYNDIPHGEFGLVPTSQSVEVNAADLSRQVKLNFTRFYGTFGSVLLTFNIGYDTTGTDVALSLNTGTVTFTNGSSEVITLVTITGNAFLKLGSTFTVYITDVQYLGSGMTDPPQIKVGYSKTPVTVTALAANTEISFSSDVTFVNEVDQTMTATLFRAGTYGIVSIDWSAGYTDLPGNITNGEISPNFGSVNMRHGQEQANITVQVSPKVNKTEAFVLRLPRAPQSFVSGGARLASSRIMIRADPSGVIQFDELSLAAQVSEVEGMITLKVLRLYGSEDNIAVYYQTVPGSAQAFLDFQSISSGIINMKPQETVATIQIQIYQDNIPEQTEIFFLNLTNVEKFPTPLQPVLSPRLSTVKSLSQISIMESNDAYGVLSLKPTTTDINESFTNVTLSVIRTGGLFGTISVTVRTVGGGESWTDQIVANINSLTNDTIADILGKRSSYESATGGMDYEVLNTVIIFQSQESEKAVKITILEDNLPEPRESILVYLTQPTGGARIATGTNIDSGQKGYAVINIAPSDLSNGLIGFAESSKNVHVNEDTSPTLVLKLTRLNAFFGVVKVNWKAKRSLTSTDQDDADLSTQLVNVAGSTLCPAEQSLCDLIVEIKNDDIPEESYTFIVLLTSAETDAHLNENSLSATVTIDPSDNVRGLLQFAQNSRVMIVGENARTVRLAVEKVYGQNYEVTVAYNTQQMTQSAEVAGVNVYPALDAQDFRGQTGTLIFPAKTQTIQFVEISLTPVLASDNPLPKQFYITLYSPSSEASVNPNASRAIVRIVRETDVPIWTVFSQSGNDSFSRDVNIITTIGQLDNLAQKTLTVENILIIEDVLKKVNEEGNQRKLPTEVITAVKDLYCKLLDEAISDARRGRNPLANLLENFAYTFIKDNSCPPAIKDDVTSFQCSSVTIKAGRWNLNQLGGHEFSIQSRGTFAAAQPMPDVDRSADGAQDECVDFHFLDYNSQTWFYTSNGEDNLMNQKVIGFGLKGRASGSIQNPVKFRIHTPDRRIAARGAKCVYFDEGSKKWVSPNDVCQVKNDLTQAEDDFVDCECTHMTSYAVIATTRDENVVGYTVWFYVICFICMASMMIVVCVHHLCFKNASFSASMNTHFFMAIFFFQLCLVLDAFLSPDEILAYNTEMNNSKCIAMGLFLHYFFLAQFTWMATQAVNLWKVLIMNDEHTDRHYIVFFIMGWGVPLILVAIFYAVTFNIYKYHTSIEVDFIYGDVNNNRDICFITNAYAAIGGILAPVLFVLLLAAIVFVKAYQLAAQWNLYDDLYFGRYNNKEIPLLLTIWGILLLTCLWLALHMIYGFLWMLVLFCICNLILAILVFVLYAVIRNPLLAFIFGPTKASYSVSGEQPDDLAAFPAPDKPFQHYNTNGSVKGSHISLLNDAWENNTTGGRSRMTVRRALPSQVYINPPVAVISPTATIDSDNPDFEELIYALKMGQSMSSSELSRSFDDDMSQLSIILDKYETKRIDIADTHV
ncbi:unnamed protein product [Lymnaea stagnalis]|uniref:G-protein coupled receptors family 2 profile 2 domain-containing protein n=1 Tax=Lymnaea stagnalis TaxID=6523 RepID=A0AAV2H441_LYMST